MKQFGNWAFPGIESTETPVGEACLRCGRVIQVGDKGLTMPFLDARQVTEPPWHRECFLESIFGPQWQDMFWEDRLDN